MNRRADSRSIAVIRGSIPDDATSRNGRHTMDEVIGATMSIVMSVVQARIMISAWGNVFRSNIATAIMWSMTGADIG